MTEELPPWHEYTVDVLGGAPGVNYASDYRNVQGLLVPTKRRVYAFDSQKRKIPEPLLVAIDFLDLAFGTDEVSARG